MVYIPEEALNCGSSADDNTSTDDTTTSDNTVVTQENRSPLVLPSGCLSSTVLRLSCKGNQEKKYYSFDLSNRMISGDTIGKVEVYPNDDAVTGTQATYDKQTFKVLLAGGEGITNVGILFIITTLSGEVLEFTCVLPIRPEGVLQVGLDANYVMGGQGPSGHNNTKIESISVSSSGFIFQMSDGSSLDVVPNGIYIQDGIVTVPETVGELPDDLVLNGNIYTAPDAYLNGTKQLPAGLSLNSNIVMTDGSVFYSKTINNNGVLCAA